MRKNYTTSIVYVLERERERKNMRLRMILQQERVSKIVLGLD